MNSTLEEAFEDHRRAVFGAAYRMLGDANDAEDIVQDTFLRLVETPPDDFDSSLEPWLVRVAINLSRDRLRSGRREVRGTWLPSPVPTDRLVASDDPGRRLVELETIGYRFLHVAEALSPTQRAVYLLRTLFEYTTAETAVALQISESAVKTNLHRARGALECEGPRRGVDREAIGRLMQYLGARDYDAVRDMLAEEISTFADGGEDFFAASAQHGRQAVMRLLRGLGDMYGELDFTAVEVNGQLGIVGRAIDGAPAGWAERFCLLPEFRHGELVALRNVLDPAKVLLSAGARHTLLIGCTGMLARASQSLARTSLSTTIVGRDCARASRAAPQATFVEGDWTQPNRLVSELDERVARDGRYDRALIWIHRDGQALWAKLSEVLAPHARVFEVLGSASGNPSELDDHRHMCRFHRRIVLGHVTGGDGSKRWLTHREISRGALEAIRADDSRLVGEV